MSFEKIDDENILSNNKLSFQTFFVSFNKIDNKVLATASFKHV
jgi:hypothetical protein